MLAFDMTPSSLLIDYTICERTLVIFFNSHHMRWILPKLTENTFSGYLENVFKNSIQGEPNQIGLLLKRSEK